MQRVTILWSCIHDFLFACHNHISMYIIIFKNYILILIIFGCNTSIQTLFILKSIFTKLCNILEYWLRNFFHVDDTINDSLCDVKRDRMWVNKENNEIEIEKLSPCWTILCFIEVRANIDLCWLRLKWWECVWRKLWLCFPYSHWAQA